MRKGDWGLRRGMDRDEFHLKEEEHRDPRRAQWKTLSDPEAICTHLAANDNSTSEFYFVG